MKSQATPGPWHTSDPESCNEVIDSMGRTIAVVEEWNSTGRGNVTLLAAAHDLLDVLERLVRLAAPIMAPINGVVLSAGEKIVAEARTTIAKATGAAV